MNKLPPEALAIIEGRHSDPFAYLGPHKEADGTVVRAYLPSPVSVSVLPSKGREFKLQPLHDAGLFAGKGSAGEGAYRLRALFAETIIELEDAYRFPSILSDYDLFLLGEGTHQRAWEILGAHPRTIDGVAGVTFVVLAPNAKRVSVVGEFNFWDGRRHAMRARGSGFWEIFIPDARIGQKYKYEILGPDDRLLPAKAGAPGVCAAQCSSHSPMQRA